MNESLLRFTSRVSAPPGRAGQGPPPPGTGLPSPFPPSPFVRLSRGWGAAGAGLARGGGTDRREPPGSSAGGSAFLGLLRPLAGNGRPSPWALGGARLPPSRGGGAALLSAPPAPRSCPGLRGQVCTAGAVRVKRGAGSHGLW